MARYVKDNNGNLILTAGGTRFWICTQAAHDRAVSAGTAPNNCIAAITDDYPSKEGAGTITAGAVTVSTPSQVFRSGNIVTCMGTCNVAANRTLAAWTTLFTLSYKPNAALQVFFSDDVTGKTYLASVLTSGAVQLHAAVTTTAATNFLWNFTYPCIE